MLDTTITMMGSERLTADTVHGIPRRDVVASLIAGCTELTDALSSALGASAEGDTAPAELPTAEIPASFRAPHHLFRAVASRLGELKPDAAIPYDGMTLRADEVVRQWTTYRP